MTTQATTRVVAAGWYQDPADEAKVRWWNGITWTEHVESKPSGGAAAAGALALESGAAAETANLERQFDLSADGTDSMTRRASIELDHRGPDTGTIPIIGMGAPRRPVRTSTASAWLLAFMPLISSALAVVAAYVYFYVTPTPLVAAIAVVLFILGFLWAVGDNRALQARGLKGPSPLLALALPLVGPLVYLIARRGKIEGSTPLIAFGALLLITVVAPVALGLSGAAPTITKALDVQNAISADLVGTGAATSVSCPPILESTAAGTVFTCAAVLPSGDSANVWVSFDTDAGQFSWALANR